MLHFHCELCGESIWLMIGCPWIEIWVNWGKAELTLLWHVWKASALLIAKIVSTVVTLGYIPILFEVSAVCSHISWFLAHQVFNLIFYPKMAFISNVIRNAVEFYKTKVLLRRGYFKNAFPLWKVFKIRTDKIHWSDDILQPSKSSQG